ncbi:MAG: EamA family transporter [Thermomicrobiales bacterium]|nr:MAG: EamA family transporter [Thermomicrobiales bacterium]
MTSAFVWGCGDFGGGLLSRRTALFGVVLLSQITGMIMAAALGLISNETVMLPSDVAWSLLSGVAGGIGIMALYRGLADGRMAVVAPITAVIAAGIPVAVGIFFEGVPAPLVLVGIAIAMVAVVLVSSIDDGGASLSGLRYALIAGIGLGTLGVFLAQISEGHAFGPLVLIRGTEAVLVAGIVLATRAAWRPRRDLVPAIALVGVLDMAGNSAFILAIQAGSLAVAAVLSSLYPVTTVILAAVLLRERVSPRNAVGVMLAMLAIGFIAAGTAA